MPTTTSLSRQTRGIVPRWPTLLVAVSCVVLVVAFPPFRILSQKRIHEADVGGHAFSAAAFSETFWNGKLLVAAKKAPLLETIVSEIHKDAAAASARYAIKAGLGNAGYYFCRGKGTVLRVERSRVIISIGGSDVALRSGPVFGNQVRDGSGLLNVNEVPGLMEFNALSAELNKLVEERVQPAFNKVTLGVSLDFCGIAEVPETFPKDGAPILTLTPVSVEVLP